MEQINNVLKMGGDKRRKIKVKETLRTVKDENGFVRIDPRYLSNI
jgi:hypothetical protein